MRTSARVQSATALDSLLVLAVFGSSASSGDTVQSTLVAQLVHDSRPGKQQVITDSSSRPADFIQVLSARHIGFVLWLDSSVEQHTVRLSVIDTSLAHHTCVLVDSGHIVMPGALAVPVDSGQILLLWTDTRNPTVTKALRFDSTGRQLTPAHVFHPKPLVGAWPIAGQPTLLAIEEYGAPPVVRRGDGSVDALTPGQMLKLLGATSIDRHGRVLELRDSVLYEHESLLDTTPTRLLNKFTFWQTRQPLWLGSDYFERDALGRLRYCYAELEVQVNGRWSDLVALHSSATEMGNGRRTATHGEAYLIFYSLSYLTPVFPPTKVVRVGGNAHQVRSMRLDNFRVWTGDKLLPHESVEISRNGRLDSSVVNLWPHLGSDYLAAPVGSVSHGCRESNPAVALTDGRVLVSWIPWSTQPHVRLGELDPHSGAVREIDSLPLRLPQDYAEQGTKREFVDRLRPGSGFLLYERGRRWTDTSGRRRQVTSVHEATRDGWRQVARRREDWSARPMWIVSAARDPDDERLFLLIGCSDGYNFQDLSLHQYAGDGSSQTYDSLSTGEYPFGVSVIPAGAGSFVLYSCWGLQAFDSSVGRAPYGDVLGSRALASEMQCQPSRNGSFLRLLQPSYLAMVDIRTGTAKTLTSLGLGDKTWDRFVVQDTATGRIALVHCGPRGARLYLLDSTGVILIRDSILGPTQDSTWQSTCTFVGDTLYVSWLARVSGSVDVYATRVVLTSQAGAAPGRYDTRGSTCSLSVSRSDGAIRIGVIGDQRTLRTVTVTDILGRIRHRVSLQPWQTGVSIPTREFNHGAYVLSVSGCGSQVLEFGGH